jgi:hypothetical protein
VRNLNWSKAGVCAGAGLVLVLLLSAAFHIAGADSHAWLLLILPFAALAAWQLYVKWPFLWPDAKAFKPPPRS